MSVLLRACLIVVLFAGHFGCSSISQTGYYWGKYSETLYPLVSDQSNANLRKHADELQRIITESEHRSLKVPPGVHADLGYTFQRLNEPDEAKQQYLKEMETYPESRTFIERLIARGTNAEQ